MSRIYVCGPMTPTRFDQEPDTAHTYIAFHEAEKKLTAAGHIVYNPATNRKGQVWDETYVPLTSDEWAELDAERYGREYRRVMSRDLRWLMECEGTALLPGWRRSQGAMFEHSVAAMLGHEIDSVKGWVEKGQIVVPTGKLPSMESAVRPHINQSTDEVQAEQTRERALEQTRCRDGCALVHEGPLEVPHHFGDAGHDLTCEAEYVHLAKGQFADVDCGVRVQLPPGTWGLITGRSSTFRQKGLHVVQGVVDNGYRGPCMVGVWNTTNHDVYVRRGEQIAQLIIMPLLRFPLEEGSVNERGGDGRGEKGFGSTD